jgi:hypothetical protein
MIYAECKHWYSTNGEIKMIGSGAYEHLAKIEGTV